MEFGVGFSSFCAYFEEAPLAFDPELRPRGGCPGFVQKPLLLRRAGSIVASLCEEKGIVSTTMRASASGAPTLGAEILISISVQLF